MYKKIEVLKRTWNEKRDRQMDAVQLFNCFLIFTLFGFECLTSVKTANFFYIHN